MKLSDILFESEDISVNVFERMLETELTNVGRNLLYRGIKVDVKTFKKIDTLDYRPPKDTDKDVNDYIDRLGKSIYGDKYISRNKNVVFTTLNYNLASSFGKAYIIFVPKSYRAVSLRDDPTDGFFYKIWSSIYNDIKTGFDEYLTPYVQFDYLKSRNTNLKKEFKLLKEKVYGKNNDTFFPNNGILSQINELSDIDKMYESITSFLNKLRGLATERSFNQINEMQEYFDSGFELLEKNTKDYFNSLKFVTAPWEETMAYEIMINCPWYVMVDKDLFGHNFWYDDQEQKYKRI